MDVKIAADGDYGVVTGYRTVTIPAGGILNLFLPTEDNRRDELDGSVTLTIRAGRRLQRRGHVDDDLDHPATTTTIPSLRWSGTPP